MTLIASSPNISNHPAIKFDQSISSEDNHSLSDENDSSAIQCFTPGGPIIQHLGRPDCGALPHFGNVAIENSTDIHIGGKNIYQGPVTIKQIVYANGSPFLCNNEARYIIRENSINDDDSSGYRIDGACVDFKNGDDCDKKTPNGTRTTGDNPNETEHETGIRKGLKWLQNISKRKPLQIGIFFGILLVFLAILATVLLVKHLPNKTIKIFDSDEQDSIQPIEYDPDITAASQIKNTKLRITSRPEWVAQPPTNITNPLVTPVPYVVIHHTATENCSSHAQCVFHVRYLQTFHIESKGFYDIAYNFLVGGDGAVYEGRGWNVEGAHSFDLNSKSIGIAFIGTFARLKPLYIQILTCKRLIEKGVELGNIRKDYKLLASTQLSENPQGALYKDLQTWPHFTKQP